MFGGWTVRVLSPARKTGPGILGHGRNHPAIFRGVDTDDAFTAALRADRAGTLMPLLYEIHILLMMIRDNPDLPAASGHWAGEAAQLAALAQPVIRGRLARIRRRREAAQACTWVNGHCC